MFNNSEQIAVPETSKQEKKDESLTFMGIQYKTPEEMAIAKKAWQELNNLDAMDLKQYADNLQKFKIENASQDKEPHQ